MTHRQRILVLRRQRRLHAAGYRRNTMSWRLAYREFIAAVAHPIDPATVGFEYHISASLTPIPTETPCGTP